MGITIASVNLDIIYWFYEEAESRWQWKGNAQYCYTLLYMYVQEEDWLTFVLKLHRTIAILTCYFPFGRNVQRLGTSANKF